jgi:prepilin-type N-terminal cleavage/methylation domain-containing protein
MQKGFTIVELLIVISIILLLAMASFPIYGNLQASSQLDENTSVLIQTLRTARVNSIARVNNSHYGVKLFNNYYVLYQGSTYESRDSSFDRRIDLGSVLRLSWTLSSDDINFSAGNGTPDKIGTIILIHEITGNKVISINTAGMIEEQ